ncbi:MAG: hypothetical protein C0467_27310 [Planctomycetaceae bacterium]|nr:hypothetical protein [Planctomycetaceae bacterium]
MGRLRRCLLFLAVAAFPATITGCGFSKRPYGHDPLLRNGAAIWGNSEMAHGPDYGHFREPLAPHAPKPANLPTMEWETARAK